MLRFLVNEADAMLDLTYKGTISNLSPAYTVNGAAVVDDDNVIVSSANTFEGFYKVNFFTGISNF